MIERRTLLKGSMAALALLSAGSKPLFGAASPNEDAAFSQARFESLKGTWLKVEAEGFRTGMQLVDIQPCLASPELEQFSLVMRGSVDAEVQEAIHKVILEDGASLEFHLRPAGCEKGGNYFTASFSHRKPTTVG